MNILLIAPEGSPSHYWLLTFNLDHDLLLQKLLASATQSTA